LRASGVESDADKTASIESDWPHVRGARTGAPRLQAGDLLQRYLILGELGAGGMSFVYRAYDSQLDRTVALKILRAKGGSDPSGKRLLREAQALAQLSHPNVTSVYDVGEHDGTVFMAMELVEGQTLQAWLREPHPLAQILEVMSAAGRGLAAAHAAGLVHRDFKPANVVLGDDGRVRVLDFGLARLFQPNESGEGSAAPTEPAPTAPREDEEGAVQRLLDEHLTRAGGVVGTPAYMAPEQHLRSEVDDRSDQFSFCLVLYQAIYGKLPFGSGGLAARAAGPPKEWVVPFPKKGVPPWLIRVLERGLRLEPAERFPSMAALLAELGQAHTRRRRIALAVAVALFVSVVSALVAVRASDGSTRECKSAGDRLHGVWDAAAKERVASALRATGHRAANDVLASVARALDGYAAMWASASTDACEATHVRGEQSRALLDLRRKCLERRRGQLAALVAVLTDAPDERAVDEAPVAALALPSVASCADEERVRGAAAPNADAGALASVQAVETAIDRARALGSLGAPERALEGARAAARDARALGIASLDAEASLLAGALLAETGALAPSEEALRHAIEAAARAGDDHALANAWLRLMGTVGRAPGRAAEGLRLQRVVETAVERVQDDKLAARLAGQAGALKRDGGDLQGAADDLVRAVEEGKRAFGGAHPAVAQWTADLAAVVCRRGDEARARELFQHALRLHEELLFATHPALATVLTGFGECLLDLGRPGEATPVLERALAILTAARAEESDRVRASSALARALGPTNAAREHAPGGRGR
jgi:predicted Ser/Thr protein kinase/tetratricopeptide (TPR) repeat protein